MLSWLSIFKRPKARKEHKRLTEEEEGMVVAAFKSGEKRMSIANKYGASYSTVCRIIRRSKTF